MISLGKWREAAVQYVHPFGVYKSIIDFPFTPTGYMDSPVKSISGKIVMAKSRMFVSLAEFIPPTGEWYLLRVLEYPTMCIIRYAEL